MASGRGRASAVLASTCGLVLALQGSADGGAGEVAAKIPLDVLPWPEAGGRGSLRLGISVRPLGPSGEALAPQRVMLATGSSALAFCNASLASAGRPTEYTSCAAYGERNSGFRGRWHRGAVTLASGVKLDEGGEGVFFTVMEEQEGMPCSEGFDGVFGIALAFPYEDPWTQERSCPGTEALHMATPLMEKLGSDGGSKSFGIRWSGIAGGGEAALYLEDAAWTHEDIKLRYECSPRLSTPLQQKELGHYAIDVVEMGLSYGTGEDPVIWSASDMDFGCKSDGGCIVDTGTPHLVVPSTVFDEIEAGASTKTGGSFQIVLLGTQGGPPVNLSMPLGWMRRNGLLARGRDTGVVLGLPLSEYYYTIFDVRQGTVTFIPETACLEDMSKLSMSTRQASLAICWIFLSLVPAILATLVRPTHVAK